MNLHIFLHQVASIRLEATDSQPATRDHGAYESQTIIFFAKDGSELGRISAIGDEINLDLGEVL